MEEARIALLQNMPIFGGIRTETLEFLLASCPVVSVPTDGDFFCEGEHGDQLFVLETGQAAVVKSWLGKSYRIQTLNAGDCFGEMAVIDHCQRSATVSALTDCTAIRISAADLYRVYRHDLKQFVLIHMNLGREVSRRLRDANDRLFRATMTTPSANIEHIFLA
jgi:CRP/FNR family cyclic AMP-dependent transcriptional regulator